MERSAPLIFWAAIALAVVPRAAAATNGPFSNASPWRIEVCRSLAFSPGWLNFARSPDLPARQGAHRLPGGAEAVTCCPPSINAAVATPEPRVGLRCLSEQQVRGWHDDGFLVLPGFFAAEEVQRAAAEAEELLTRHRSLIDTRNLRCRFLPNVATGECEFECFDPVIDLSLACHQLALAPKLLAALGDLYGEEACLFKDKLIFKPPGVKGYDLHQDYIAWPSFPRSFLTVLVPLDAAGRDNGCTEVFPGYHHNGPLTPEDGQYRTLPPGTVDEAKAVPLVLAPGDVAVFGGFTPHRSAPNRSGRWRRQLYVSYNKLSDGGHQRPQHYHQFREWLRKKYADHGKREVYFC